MIEARITGTEAVRAYLDGLGRSARTEIPATVGRLALKLATKVQAEKLSGQVLKNQSGRLRRSIHAQLRAGGDVSRALVGTNVEYAAIHEYGGTIKIPPKSMMVVHKYNAKGDIIGFARRNDKRQLARWFEVKAHDIKMPERSYLRTALAEMRPEILARIDEAVRRIVTR